MYLTYQEVLDYYPQIQEAVNAGRLTQSVVEQWIKNASNIIDGTLSIRYQVPFNPVPPLIKTLCFELFEYFWQKYVYTPTATGDEVPWLYARYDRIMKMLNDIAQGLVKLTYSDGSLVQSYQSVKLIKTNQTDVKPIFDIRKEMWESEVDKNYGDNIK